MPDMAGIVDIVLTTCFTISVSARIDGVGENMMKGGVGGRGPTDVGERVGLGGEGEFLGAEPEPDLACATDLGESVKDGADGADDGFVGMETNIPVGFAPDKADGESSAEFAASGLVADASVKAGAQDVEFRLGHGALEAEDQSIVKIGGVIETVAVGDEGVGHTTEIEETIPVGVIAGEARDFQAQDDADVGQRDLGGQTIEPGSIDFARSGTSKVLVDDDDARTRPAEGEGPIDEFVLAVGGFGIAFQLGGRGLSDVDDGRTLEMRGFDFGVIGHGRAPVCEG